MSGGRPWQDHRAARPRLCERTAGIAAGPSADPEVRSPCSGIRRPPDGLHRGVCYIGSRRVSFEADSFANVGCFFDGNADIRVGAGVQIGMWSVFATATHEISKLASRRAGRDVARPIHIGSGSWIGARSTVLPGVDIGEGCVIGAESLVIRTCDPNWVYLGAPARKSRSLTEEDPSPASNSMTSGGTRTSAGSSQPGRREQSRPAELSCCAGRHPRLEEALNRNR